MNSSFLRVVHTTNSDCDLLDRFLIAFLLHLGLANGDLVDSETVDSLACSFNHRTLLDQEVKGVVPELSLMHLNVHPDSFLFKPQLILTLSKPRNLNVIDTVLISLVNNQLSLRDLVVDI